MATAETEAPASSESRRQQLLPRAYGRARLPSTLQAHPVSQLAPYSSNQLTDREPAMARNRVQFQKGYSLVQFMDDYGTLDELGT